MKRSAKKITMTEDCFGCGRDYDGEDNICKKHCALRIRCTIEKGYMEKIHILEELAAGAEMMFSIQ